MSTSEKRDVQDQGIPDVAGAPTALLLAAVSDELRRRAAAGEADLVVRFAELFLADATTEFFAERTPTTVAALVLSAFRHLQRSAPDRADVMVVTPEQEAEPWSAPVTMIRTHAAEAPFIVSSIREYLHSRQLQVEQFLHPVLQVVRDADGMITSIAPGSAGAPLESLVHCEVARIGDATTADQVRAEDRKSVV